MYSRRTKDKIGRQKVVLTSRWVRKAAWGGEVTTVMGCTSEAFEVVLFQHLHVALGRSFLGVLQFGVEKPQLPRVVGGTSGEFQRPD